jgi:transcriptional regulator with XRE-family HTH domain
MMLGGQPMVQGLARLRVPELLEKTGWSISELMRRSGLSYPTVFRLAKGKGGPVSLDTAIAIAEAFGVPLEEVIEEKTSG